jgi:transcription antitermination factor NusG
VRECDDPLFPGYLFCRVDIQDQLLPIFTTPGVISIVSAGRTPLPISDEDMAAIQAVVRSGLVALPYPYLAVGTRAFIEKGPLAGMEGIVLRTDKKSRLVVSVPMLQRSVVVEIERDWARPVEGNGNPKSSLGSSVTRDTAGNGNHNPGWRVADTNRNRL